MIRYLILITAILMQRSLTNGDPKIMKPPKTGVNSGDGHTINCVIRGITAQINGIEWTTEANTGDVYSSNDGTFDEKEKEQVSTLSFTSEQILALKKIGEENTFTCKVVIPGLATPLTATQTVGIDTSYSPKFPGNCVVGDGAGYRGDTAVGTSEDGILHLCDVWDNGNHPDINSQTYPNKGLEKANYCRNPTADDYNDPKPWCFQVDGRTLQGWLYLYCDIRQCASVGITKATIDSSSEHTISCVVAGIFGQVSGIEWTTETVTDNSYLPKDGVYKEGSQTSTLTLSRDQLIALKEAGGEEISFTCKATVPDFSEPQTATETVTIKDKVSVTIKPSSMEISSPDDYTISCVIGNVFQQVSDIAWTSDAKAGMNYNTKDGVYKRATQTSTLTLSRDQLSTLKKSGAQYTFTCTVKVPGTAEPLTATQTIKITFADDPDPRDCEKTFDCPPNAALLNARVSWFMIISLLIGINCLLQQEYLRV